MTSTTNNHIPLVPENTIDPAAGLNLSLQTLDALVQLSVVSVGDNAPPGSPAEGARHIVGTAPTGAWAGQAAKLAAFQNGAWEFYPAHIAVNQADGGRVWVLVAGAWQKMVDAGWTAGAGTPNKGAFDAATATTAETAARVLAIETALFALGLLSA